MRRLAPWFVFRIDLHSDDEGVLPSARQVQDDELRTVAVHADESDYAAQHGLMRSQPTIHLRDTELSFPIDPGADASLDGWHDCHARCAVETMPE